MTTVRELKAQIEAETNPEALVALYQQLVPMLREPALKIREIEDPTLRAQAREEVRERRRRNRELGLGRNGKPMTEEQKAKLAARWTPEKRAEASARSKGRKPSEEQIAKVREAAAARKQKQAAMEARLKELEALLAAKTSDNGGVATADASADNSQTGRRQRGNK